MNARRILALILALTLCFGLMSPAVAFATEEEPTEAVEQTGEQENEASAPAEEVTEEIASTEPVVAEAKEPEVTNYADFLACLKVLEGYAKDFAATNTAYKAPQLIINYIRTGVERYNSGSWGIMAGYEDADFAKFVERMEVEVKSQIIDSSYINVTGLKNLKNFKLPNGKNADIGHVFGSMDITYHNNFGLNHADVSGWAGDLVDLLEVGALESGAGRLTGTLEEMITKIGESYFLTTVGLPNYPSFSKEDWDGDMDAFYVMHVLKSVDYGIAYTEDGKIDLDDDIYCLTEIFMNYMTEDLDDEYRAAYFMSSRLGVIGTRAQVRAAV
jgi:hypothetical protein